MNKKFTTAFQRAIDGLRMLPLSPPKGGLKTDFSVFALKFNFSQIKSATKFCSVKTSSCKVVQHADNCTVNLSDVGTVHCSHTVSLR